ncbi:SDR family oxidoreductase [Sphingorhabdus sp.]|jgi:pteridine reductase|uniref:SDR family oxidoreductase n=2 Tax=Sphingorhabdus sp. TaxID=1902408 RepID=UPI003BB0B522|nr:SDR family oxidoreductase [Sphingomonadales bacterium]
MTRPLALVTGGVRRLGAVIAAKLAGAGYDLALTSHGDGQPDPALAQAIEESAVQWHHFAADLSDTAQAEALMLSVCAHFGRAPDLLVNNAAIFGQDGWSAMDAASLEAHFRLNLFAPVLLAKALVSAAGDSFQPAIVHIVDQRIRNPNGDQLSYTLSKQALAESVRSLASAFGLRARVNGVAPGLVIPTEDYSDVQMGRLNAAMPLGQLPDPENVAEAVLYLARARDVTGQILYVDGGAHLKSYPRDFLHL